jgi:hypothetical protein
VKKVRNGGMLVRGREKKQTVRVKVAVVVDRLKRP